MVLRRCEVRFPVLNRIENAVLQIPRVDALRLALELLVVLMLSVMVGAGGNLLIHSDGWRQSLPRPLASAVGQSRAALLNILRPGGLPLG